MGKYVDRPGDEKHISVNFEVLDSWISQVSKASKKINGLRDKLRLMDAAVLSNNESKGVRKFVELNRKALKDLDRMHHRFDVTAKEMKAFSSKAFKLDLEETELVPRIERTHSDYILLYSGGTPPISNHNYSNYKEAEKHLKELQDQHKTIFDQYKESGKHARQRMSRAFDSDSLHDSKLETYAAYMQDNPDILEKLKVFGEDTSKTGAYIVIAGILLIPVTGGVSIALVEGGAVVSTYGGVVDLAATGAQVPAGQASLGEFGVKAVVSVGTAGVAKNVEVIAGGLGTPATANVISKGTSAALNAAASQLPTPDVHRQQGLTPGTKGLRLPESTSAIRASEIWINPITGIPFEYRPSVITITNNRPAPLPGKRP